MTGRRLFKQGLMLLIVVAGDRAAHAENARIRFRAAARRQPAEAPEPPPPLPEGLPQASPASPRPQGVDSGGPEFRREMIPPGSAAPKSPRRAHGTRPMPSPPRVLEGPKAGVPASPQGLAPPAPLSLRELEQIALRHNPTLVQAGMALRAAQGRYVQAGLYPNPALGYAGGDMGLEGTSGQQGMVTG